MKDINIFCFGFGQVAKNFIKSLILKNIILTYQQLLEVNLQKKYSMVLIIIELPI